MFALIWTLFIVVAVWFLLLRPQRKRMQEHQALMQSLATGHEVVTAGGIHGRIEAMDDEVLRVEVAPGTVIRVAKRAIARDVTDEQQAEVDTTPSDTVDDD